MITLKDLAKELKVSVSTVSKALSDSHEISKETKDKVLALAQKRNYIPNTTAISLRRKRTNTIGVIIPNIFNHFYAKILSGIEHEARNNGYKIIIAISNETLRSEQEGISFFSNGSVDGILLAPSEETEKRQDIQHFEALQNKGIPFVFFDRYFDTFEVDKVIIDDFESAKNTIEYLKTNGRKRILVVSLLKNLSVGTLRKQGVLTHKEVVLLEMDDELAFESKLTTIVTSEKYDAIFALDELSGIIALNLIKEKQIDIPREMALISFSQGILSTYSYPKLSTVNQHAKTIGETAVSLLLARIENAYKPIETKIVKTTLNLKETT